MENRQKNQTNSSKINIYLILIVLLLIYSLFSGAKALADRNEKLRQITENESVINELNTSISELEEQIANSKSDEFIEKAAREDLGMVKPREIIYVVKDSELPKDNK